VHFVLVHAKFIEYNDIFQLLSTLQYMVCSFDFNSISWFVCIYMERKNTLHVILMIAHYKCDCEDPGKNMSSISPYMCRKRRLNGVIMCMKPEKPRSRVTAGVTR
jgi:hypothetical protein